MPDKEIQERLLSPADVATRLNVSIVTVGRWLREGKLKGVKAGRQWRVRESELEAFLGRGDK
jgi:excisionase family DNA binding protein